MLPFPSSLVSPPSASTPKMVMADGVPPLVETCVLLPEEFALKVEAPNARLMPPSLLNLLPHLASGTPGQSHLPPHLLERLAPSLGPLSSPLTPLSPALSPLGMPLGGPSHAEECIKVCATRRLPAHTRYLPFSGTVRADKLPHLPCLPPMDPRQRYGSYDEVCERATGRVRLCNWVRFVGYSVHFTPQVNMVASKVRGSVVFEVVREVAAGERLLAFLLPDMSADDTLLLPALTLLRSSLYRRTIDSIMAEAPLDLSRSLLTSPSSPPPSETLTSSAGGTMKRKLEIHSPVRSPSPVSSSPTPNHSPTSNIPHFPSVPSSSFFPLRRHSVGLGMRELESSRMSPMPLNLTPPTSLSGVSSSIISGGRTPSTSDLPSSLHNETPVSLGPPKRRERTMLPCSECGKAFDRPSLLKRHMRTHTGEKPHVCDVCGKGFSTSSSLNTHRRIHSGEKPHQCGVCGKRFTASSNLYYHKMTHVKEKPHKCSLCTRSFPTPGDLRSHMFVHNGQWPHKCSVCGKGFSKLTNLRNHALLHAEMKRTDRQLTSLPSSLTSPASTSSSDAPLTPPAGYSPPAYSSFTPSTSQASPSSDISPSPSASQLSHSPPPSPSESIVLSSSSNPNSPIRKPDDKAEEEAPSASSQTSTTFERAPPSGSCTSKSDTKATKTITTPALISSISSSSINTKDDVYLSSDAEGNAHEGTAMPSVKAISSSLTPPSKEYPAVTTSTSAASSSFSSTSSNPSSSHSFPASPPTPTITPRPKGPPKLSFSLDSLLASTKPKSDTRPRNELDLVSREGEKTNLGRDSQGHSTRGGSPEANNNVQTTQR